MKSASDRHSSTRQQTLSWQTRPRCYDLLGFSPPTATFVSLMPTRLILASLILCASGSTAIAQQNLSVSLFERYVDSLREEAGIPSIAAAITQDGNIVWQRGFGRPNVDSSEPPTLDTPYLIGGLSQTLGSTLVLRKCLDQGHAEVTDPVSRWTPFGDQSTLAHLLAHATTAGSFRFDPARFAVLTRVVEECATAPYAQLLEDEIFGRLAMSNSVPGSSIVGTSNAADLYSAGTLSRYSSTLGRLAVPYRVDSRGRATRSDIGPRSADAATGVISTVQDLVRFDAALRDAGALLTAQTRQQAWTQVTAGGSPLPTGLGWFVQNYNNQAIVWHFGVVEGGYSSLIVKIPNRGITLIMLANSDGLSAPFGLENGDIQKSLFAQTFLKLFLP
jgi:CubicO group peptidase (beta-lactamase class C family)